MKFLLLPLVAFVAVAADFQPANQNQHKFLTDPKIIPEHYARKETKDYRLIVEDKKIGIVAGPQKIFFDHETLLFESNKAYTNDEPENECKTVPSFVHGAIGKRTLGGFVETEEGKYCGLTTTKDKFPSPHKFKKSLPILTFTDKDHNKTILVLECGTLLVKNFPDFEEIIELKSITDRNDDSTLFGLFVNRTQKGRTTYGVCSYSMLDISQRIDDAKLNVTAFNKKNNKWENVQKSKLDSNHVLVVLDETQTPTSDYAILNFNFTTSKNITNYAVMSFTGLDNTQYGLHFFAHADGKISKAVTDGKNVNVTIDLYKDIMGKTLQMEIFNGFLIVLTNEAVYSLPLFACDQFWSCSNCIEERDPQCLWDGNSCVQAQEFHRNQSYTQRIKDGNPEFCVGMNQELQTQRLMDLLTKQLEKSKDELKNLEQIRNDQGTGFGNLDKELESVKKTLESVEAKLTEVNQTMSGDSGYARSHHFTDLLLTGFFAAVFCALFVVFKRVAVYAKVRYVDKNPNYRLMDSVIMGNANDRYTSPTNGDL